MKEYIENILHQEVIITPYEDVQRLPLAYRSNYTFNMLAIAGQEVLLAMPLERLSLAMLRKQHHQIEVYTGLLCVLYLKEMNYYSRDRMIAEGIPFVWEGHQLYLPFLGMLLNDNQRKELRSCTRISFLTQKLLLTALYQGWEKVTVTQAAGILNVSKMSVTRCFDELEAMNIPYLTVRNRARSITADQDKKAMWETIRSTLRNPVITTYALKEKPEIAMPFSGISALAYYSLLNEETCPVFAITKKKLSELDLTDEKISPAGETPKCNVQEIGYQITYEKGEAIDPLTTLLCISEEEQADPRISLAIEEMLEEHVW